MLVNIFSYRSVSEGPSPSFFAERFRNYFKLFYLMLRSQGKRKYKCIINLGRIKRIFQLGHLLKSLFNLHFLYFIFCVALNISLLEIQRKFQTQYECS
jgi:hypothetical protein